MKEFDDDDLDCVVDAILNKELSLKRGGDKLGISAERMRQRFNKVLKLRNKDRYAELLKQKQDEASKYWTDPAYYRYVMVDPYIINSLNLVDARQFKEDFLR